MSNSKKQQYAASHKNDDRQLDRQVRRLGFPKLETIASLKSIAHLFPSRRTRCGIYLLTFSDGSIYIGQAKNVVCRFTDHRRHWDREIAGFTFVSERQQRLDETEQRLIQCAERSRLTLRNTIHVSEVVGDTDLDLVIPVDEQNGWLSHRTHYRRTVNTGEGRISLPRSHTVRFADRFRRFQSLPGSDDAIKLLRRYVHGCVPFPLRTEYSFWALTCLPKTNLSWPRLACISMAMMETFVVGWKKDDPHTLWGFINVASDVLFEKFGSRQRLRELFPTIDIRHGRHYRDAGQHQTSLHASDGRDLRKLIEDGSVRRAAAELALRLMRKRATIYRKYHCIQLADEVMKSTDR